jgi:hypothetical protein
MVKRTTTLGRAGVCVGGGGDRIAEGGICGDVGVDWYSEDVLCFWFRSFSIIDLNLTCALLLFIRLI